MEALRQETSISGQRGRKKKLPTGNEQFPAPEEKQFPAICNLFVRYCTGGQVQQPGRAMFTN